MPVKRSLYRADQSLKDACMNANGGIAKEASRLNRELKDSEKERRKLEKNYSARKRLLQKQLPLLVLSKKQMRSGGFRGRMISASDRENAVLLINEAIKSGASCKRHVNASESQNGLSTVGKSEKRIRIPMKMDVPTQIIQILLIRYPQRYAVRS